MLKKYLIFGLLWALSLILTIFIEINIGLLWGFLSLIFGLLLIIADKSNISVLKIFISIVFITHTIVPVLFMIRKEEYTYSGWSAVKNFDFDFISFVEIYFLLFLFYIGIIFSLIIFKSLYKLPHISTPINIKFHNSKNLYIILLCIFSFPINIWMFNNNIGITGMGESQEYLPFKIGGILYYLMRFIVPATIFYLFYKSDRNIPISFMIIIYAFFAALSQSSKATLFLIMLPVIFFSFSDKKYFLLTFYTFSILILYPLIDFSRNYVYINIDGINHKNYFYSFFEILYLLIIDIKNINFLESIYSILSRVGGGQDVILGYQYESSAIGRTSWDEFSRIFLNQPSDFNSTYELYGFNPVGGFSAGYGGLSSMIFQIVGKNYFILPLLIALISLMLYVGEFFIIWFSNKYSSKVLGEIIAIMYIIFLYVLGNMLWFEVFFLVISLFILVNKIKLSDVKY
jgi:hypothetical protein